MKNILWALPTNIYIQHNPNKSSILPIHPISVIMELWTYPASNSLPFYIKNFCLPALHSISFYLSLGFSRCTHTYMYEQGSKLWCWKRIFQSGANLCGFSHLVHTLGRRKGGWLRPLYRFETNISELPGLILLSKSAVFIYTMHCICNEHKLWFEEQIMVFSVLLIAGSQCCTHCLTRGVNAFIIVYCGVLICD